jgi:hypothetical protein
MHTYLHTYIHTHTQTYTPGTAETVAEGVQQDVENVLQQTGQKAANLARNIGETAQQTRQKAGEKAQNVIDAAKSAGQKLQQTAKNAQDAVKSAGETEHNVVEVGKPATKDAGDHFKSAGNDVTDLLEEIGSKIPDQIAGKTAAVPPGPQRRAQQVLAREADRLAAEREGLAGHKEKKTPGKHVDLAGDDHEHMNLRGGGVLSDADDDPVWPTDEDIGGETVLNFAGDDHEHVNLRGGGGQDDARDDLMWSNDVIGGITVLNLPGSDGHATVVNLHMNPRDKSTGRGFSGKPAVDFAGDVGARMNLRGGGADDGVGGNSLPNLAGNNYIDLGANRDVLHGNTFAGLAGDNYTAGNEDDQYAGKNTSQVLLDTLKDKVEDKTAHTSNGALRRVQKRLDQETKNLAGERQNLPGKPEKLRQDDDEDARNEREVLERNDGYFSAGNDDKEGNLEYQMLNDMRLRRTDTTSAPTEDLMEKARERLDDDNDQGDLDLRRTNRYVAGKDHGLAGKDELDAGIEHMRGGAGEEMARKEKNVAGHEENVAGGDTMKMAGGVDKESAPGMYVCNTMYMNGGACMYVGMK